MAQDDGRRAPVISAGSARGKRITGNGSRDPGLGLLRLEGWSVLGWMAGGATGLGRSTGQRDDPEGRNRVLGEDHGEKKGKDLTCGSGLEAGEARACGAGERSARAEGEG